MNDVVVENVCRQLNSGPDGRVIFLKGKWGVGKTYLWKHEIAKNLPKDKTLYISLFGIGSVEDLRSKVITSLLAGGESESLFGRIRSWGSKVDFGTLLKDKLGVNLNIDLLELVQDSRWICFDDLERISEKASIREILGFINQLAEHKNFKCLIVFNDEEMHQSHRDDFYSFKEKLGLRTFEIKSNVELRAASMIVSLEKEHSAKLEHEERESLLWILNERDVTNIRLIRFMIECMYIFKTSIKQELTREMIYFLVSLVLFDTQDRAQEPWDFFNFSPVSYELADEAEKQSSKFRFIREYFTKYYDYAAYQTIFEIVRNGFASAEARDYDFPQDEDKNPIDLTIWMMLSTNYFYQEDSEIRDRLNEVQTLLESETELTLGQILKLLQVQTACAHYLKIEPPKLTQKIEDKVSASISVNTNLDAILEYLSTRDGSVHKEYLDRLLELVQKPRFENGMKVMESLVSTSNKAGLRQLLQNRPELAAHIFSRGIFAKIFEMEHTTESKHRMAHTVIRTMLDHSYSDIEKELEKIGDFLIDEHARTNSLMTKRRLETLIALLKQKQR